MGNSSQISNLQTELKYLDKLKCYRILSDSGGPPPWGAGRWVDGGGGRYGCLGGVPCMHACTHTHAHTCMLNMLNMDASMLAAICNSIHVCVHVHACACVWGHLPCPQIPPTHLPPPQSRREPKTPNFNNSWTNRDNLILFEDSLPQNIPELISTIADHPRQPPPTCPAPQSWGNPNRKNYNNSWTNRDNSILFEDLGPLNPPAHI